MATKKSNKEQREQYKNAVHRVLDAKSPRELADILYNNFNDLNKALKLPKGYDDLTQVIDVIHSNKDKTLRANIIGQLVEGNPKGILSAQDEKAIARNQRADEATIKAQQEGNKFFAAVAGLARIIPASANLLHAARLKAGIGPVMGTGIMAASWAIPASMAYAAISPNVESLPEPGSTVYKTSIHESCTQEFLRSASYGNVVYATTFDNTGNEGTQYAYDAIMASARHGVPLISLHVISYFESAQHTDMQAGGSTASSLFQIIDSQKLRYVQNYGQDTFMYQDALDRLTAGESYTGQHEDRLLVQAVDTVVETSLEELDSMVANKNMSGPVFYAFRSVDNPVMATELITLDLKKQVPEITDPNLSPQQQLDLTTSYYGGDHFLGTPNHNLFKKLSELSPNTPIAASAAFIGEAGQEKLVRVADLNPAFMTRNSTAPQALEGIFNNFQRHVQAPYQTFVNAFQQDKSATELCRTEKLMPVPYGRIARADETPEVVEAQTNAVPFPTPLSQRPLPPGNG